MLRLLKIHTVFLLVALLIAFVIVPADLIFFDKISDSEISYYYRDAIEFNDSKAWKLTFTWFLGLACGRLMLRVLMK